MTTRETPQEVKDAWDVIRLYYSYSMSDINNLREKQIALRDMFAGQALQGLLSYGGWKADFVPPNGDLASIEAYKHADAMVAERAKVKGEAESS